MKKILIACQCATNKGDRAIAEYLISQLKCYPNVKIMLSTTEPSLWDIPSYKDVEVIGCGYRHFKYFSKKGFVNKIVRELEFLFYRYVCFTELLLGIKLIVCGIVSRSFIKKVQEADLVIVTGGHHITSIRNKNALFAITYDISLISRCSSKYVLWSQTIGPLVFTSNRIKDFFGKIIRNAESVYLRDANSFDCINSLYGQIDNLRKSYDSVFGFGSVVFDNYNNRKQRIGVSIFNGLGKAKEANKHILSLLQYCSKIGYEIYFFRMEHDKKELEDINDLVSLIPDTSRVHIFPFNTSTQQHLEMVASCNIFVGYKTHSVIMALTTATPLIGICYHNKTRDFMSDYDLQQYAIDDTNIGEGELQEAFTSIINRASDIHDIEQKHSLVLSERIKRDFEEMMKRNFASETL